MIFQIGQTFVQRIEADNPAIDLLLDDIKTGNTRALTAVGYFGEEHFACAAVSSIERHRETNFVEHVSLADIHSHRRRSGSIVYYDVTFRIVSVADTAEGGE